MLYNIFPNNDIELNKCIEEASKEYSGFFNIPNDEFSVRVFSMKKEIFDEFKSIKEDYVVAFACPRSNIIFICNHDDIKNIYNDIEYKKLIKHEIVHVYAYMYVNFNKYVPNWLHEGLARYLSGQMISGEVCKDLKTLFNDNILPNVIYSGGGIFVKHLIETYGNKKFLEFFNELRNLKSSNEVSIIFMKHYNKDIKEVLNEILGENNK